jgi:glucokinase
MNIVFDIGGSKLRVASSRDGKTLGTPVIVPSPKDPAVAVQKLIATARDLTEGAKITGIAGGIAGVLNPEHTTLTAASNLPRWVGFNITEPLAAAFNCPVKLINDAMLGALGEANFGSGQGYKSILYYTIGTGVGGTWIINGQLPNNGTYEPGHQILDWQSLTTMEKLVDQAATAREQVHYIAIGIFNSLLHWPADIIILGGGKTIHKTWSAKDVKAELEKIAHAYVPIPELGFAKLGDAAGLYGALHLAKQL